MATNAHISGALSPAAGDCFGIGPKTVGTPELLRMKSWLEGTYAEELDGREANADDMAAWLWRQVAGQVRRYEERLRDAANAEPAVEEFTA